MSALAPERVRTAPARKPKADPKPAPLRLRLITRATPEVRARRAPKTPFVILLLTLLAGGLLSLLLLNTVIDQDAFTLHDLQSKQTVLDVTEAQLHETANSDADPAVLASKAAALGMVPAGPPTFLKQAKLPKGGTMVGNLYIVQGTPTPAPAAAAGTTATTTAPAVAPTAAVSHAAATSVAHTPAVTRTAAATATHTALHTASPTAVHTATTTHTTSTHTTTTGRP